MEALDPVLRHIADLRNPGHVVESVAQQRLFSAVLSSRNLGLHSLLCLEAFSGSVRGICGAAATLSCPRPESPIWCGGILHVAGPHASLARAPVYPLSIPPPHR